MLFLFHLRTCCEGCSLRCIMPNTTGSVLFLLLLIRIFDIRHDKL